MNYKQVSRACAGKKNQGGFTLVELAIVVAIGLLLFLGISKANKVMADSKVTQEIGELKQIAAAVQKQYANKANYASATMTAIIGMNSIPEERKLTATTASNRWGGTLTLAPATVNTTSDSIAMTSTELPKYECTQLISQVENGFTRIDIAGTAVKPAGGVLNETTLSTQCNSASTVTAIYYFSK